MKVSKEDYNYIRELNKYSAEVWNLCLKLQNEYRESNDGKWIGRNDLQKLTKSCVPLHAKGIHHVVHKFLHARDSAIAAKSKGENNKYPYKEKKYYVTGWDSQAIKIKGNRIIMSKPLIKTEKGNKKQQPLICHAKDIPDNIVQIELIYRNGYKLSIKYIEKSSYLQIDSKNVSAIDLGEIHSITSIDNNGNAIIITGRKMRSIKQRRNKMQANIYSLMSNCKKNSNQYNKYLKASRNLSHTHNKMILDCVHKITKQYVDYCILNNISTVFYGDLDSATRNTKGRVRSATGQKLQQFNHGEITRQLENKLSRYGIKMIKVKEYYTSKKCPMCKELNNPLGRNYTCKHCGYRQHRDIVGAMNILNDNTDFNVTKYSNLKYLRIE